MGVLGKLEPLSQKNDPFKFLRNEGLPNSFGQDISRTVMDYQVGYRG